MTRVVITAGDLRLEAELADTPTARAVAAALPIEGQANVWGKEIYFDVDLELALEDDARQQVEVGDLAYWPQGPALCLFFGPTPVSTDHRPRAYSPVNVFGRIRQGADRLAAVGQGETVRLQAAGKAGS